MMRRLLDGRVRLAVSTEMGARGLDIPGLTHVINLDLPTDASHYVHRAGRCGRAGADGTVLSLARPGDKHIVNKFTRQLGVPLNEMELRGGKVEVGRLVGGSAVRAPARGGRTNGSARRPPRPKQTTADDGADGDARPEARPPKKKQKMGYPRLQPKPRGRSSERSGGARAQRRSP